MHSSTLDAHQHEVEPAPVVPPHPNGPVSPKRRFYKLTTTFPTARSKDLDGIDEIGDREGACEDVVRGVGVLRRDFRSPTGISPVARGAPLVTPSPVPVEVGHDEAVPAS